MGKAEMRRPAMGESVRIQVHTTPGAVTISRAAP